MNNPLILFLQEIYQRFIAPSPKFFVIWQWITGTITAITGIPNLLQMLNVTLPITLANSVTKGVAFCSALVFLFSKLPVNDTSKLPLTAKS